MGLQEIAEERFKYDRDWFNLYAEYGKWWFTLKIPGTDVLWASLFGQRRDFNEFCWGYSIYSELIKDSVEEESRAFWFGVNVYNSPSADKNREENLSKLQNGFKENKFNESLITIDRTQAWGPDGYLDSSLLKSLKLWEFVHDNVKNTVSAVKAHHTNFCCQDSIPVEIGSISIGTLVSRMFEYNCMVRWPYNSEYMFGIVYKEHTIMQRLSETNKVCGG